VNKLLIPTILIATVMIAGIFALIPVQKGTAVHELIIAAIEDGNLELAIELLEQITGDHADLSSDIDAIDMDLEGVHAWITGGHADITGEIRAQDRILYFNKHVYFTRISILYFRN